MTDGRTERICEAPSCSLPYVYECDSCDKGVCNEHLFKSWMYGIEGDHCYECRGINPDDC